jgi:transposase
MERLSMRKIMDVLRLHSAGRLGRQIAASTGIGRGTVSDYLLRASAAGLSWPLPDAMDEAALEARLFPDRVEYALNWLNGTQPPLRLALCTSDSG